MSYVGRFAPSPTGALHAGSLAAALASWLDARAHGGRWLVRIEDVDGPRCVPGAGMAMLEQLAAFGLVPDDAPAWQSTRAAQYEAALARLTSEGWAYPCACTRAEIVQAGLQRGLGRERHGDLVYPGTCRSGLRGKAARAMRLLVAPSITGPAMPLEIAWHDRRLGAQGQNVSEAVGDFVLKRADGWWAYQLAVVVDDAAQGITHVVRGADLADNTPRQIHLQRALGLPTPAYLHTPLVLGADGEKLSKQNGAAPVDATNPLAALRAAGRALGVEVAGDDVGDWLANATVDWRARWVDDRPR
ncbi:MAG: tRNA glutamyl-Q(34) synthetase GluQRS [Rhizobiales bacterium]|nr:tRNA glutamyl-Q(34) synthetase GluQRS [Rhizobacter sp.]